MKTGITPIFWMLVAIATIAAVMILFRAHPRRQWGFKESVKDPKQWGEDIEQSSRALERAIEEAKQWTEAQISAAVYRFVFDVVSSQDAGEDANVLESLGPRIHSSVLQILSDDSLRS